MGLTRIPVGRLEKSSKADMLTRLTTRILIHFSRSLGVMNKGERIDNFESISNESPIVAKEKDQGEMVSTSSSSIQWCLGTLVCSLLKEKKSLSKQNKTE